MPTYSYRCDACESEFEKEQRISEAAIRKCPSCGKLKARRMITSGNFILKGGGWYSDGYGAGTKSSRSKDKDESASSSSTKSTSTGAKDDAKSSKDDAKSSKDDAKSSKDDAKPAGGGSGSPEKAAAAS